MKSFGHLIKVNKLVILTGLFFWINSNVFSQNKIIDLLNKNEVFQLNTNWGISVSKSIMQIYTSTDKSKAISNFENGRQIYYYEISKIKGLFNRYFEIETYYSYDELFRLVSIRTNTDALIEFDSIHYNTEGRIDFISHIVKSKSKINQAYDYSQTYILSSVKNDNYILVDSSYMKDTISLDKQNGIINENQDSIFYSVKNDTIIYSKFQKLKVDNSRMKTKEFLFVNEKIQIETSYKKRIFRIYRTKINYYYEGDNLVMLRKNNDGNISYVMYNYGFNGYLQEEIYLSKSVTYGKNAKCLARFTATATFLWYFKELPVILLGNILPCSLINWIKKSGSL